MAMNGSLSDLCDEFNVPKFQETTVWHLVVHTSGLKAWAPLYLLASSLLSVSGAIASLPLETGPEQRVVYSDLNFILLGQIVEKCRYGSRVDLVAHEEIIDALNLKRTLFNPSKENWGQVSDLGGRRIIAASEKGNEYEMQTCIEQGYLPDPNGRRMRDELRVPQSAFRTQTI